MPSWQVLQSDLSSVPRRDGLVLSILESHKIGRGFAPRLTGRVITKSIIKIIQADSLIGTTALGKGFGSAGRLPKESGSVWNCQGHAKKFLGSIAKIWYCTLLPDFYLVLHFLS